MSLKILSRICLIFLLFVIVNYVFIAFTSVPTEGDSLNYHIPIAKAYLEGNIFSPEKIQGAKFLIYSPASSEGILSLFYLLHLPPNLFNVFGVILFFLSLYYLARKFNLEKNYSLIFATSIATLNGVVRWVDTQKIDIYLASFFVLSLALLQKPEKKISYYLKLGIVLGMLIGSKYSGLLFAGVIVLIYGKKLLSFFYVKSFIIFLLPFSILGLIWYLRNYLVTGNPMYPQGFLIFKDAGFTILVTQVWRIVTSSWNGFFGTLNAIISEYMIWAFAVPVSALYFIRSRTKFGMTERGMTTLLVVGLLNLIIYLFLPSDNYQHIMISVIRYSYPAFIPFILYCFLLAKKYKKEELVAITVVANLFFVSFPMSYNPKLLFVFIPLALFFYFKYRS